MPKNFCQNPLCHLSDTDDRKKKGVYQTRKAKKDWFNYFCTRECFHQYFSINADSIVRFIGLKINPSSRSLESENYWERSRAIQHRPNWKHSNYLEIPKIINRELNQN